MIRVILSITIGFLFGWIGAANECHAATLAEQVQAMPPGTWAQITTENKFDDVDPRPANCIYCGNTGPRAVLEAWNSGAMDTGLGMCGSILYFGGGHTDYSGNEVMSLDLCGDAGSPKWRRLSAPYSGPITWPLANGAFPDGTPSPAHNYACMEFDPWNNVLFVCESQVNYSNATVSRYAWLFALGTQKWLAPILHRGAMEGVSALDSKRKLVWFQPKAGRAGELTSFNAATNERKYYGAPTAGILDSVMSYNPDADVLVLTSFRNGLPIIHERDLSHPEKPWATTTVIGAPDKVIGQHAMEWSADRHAMLIYMDLLRDGNVYEIPRVAERAYKWNNLTSAVNAVVPVPAAVSVGAFKKMRMAVAGGVQIMIGQLQASGPAIAFRIPNSTVTDVPPSIPTSTEPAGPCLPSEFLKEVKSWRECSSPTTNEPAPITGLAEFCKDASVIACEFFDSKINTGTIRGVNTPPSTPTVVDGTLQFTIPSNSPADAGGEVRWTFPPIGEGKFIAFTYKTKADAAALALPDRKEFILWRGASSCTDLQLVQAHYYVAQIPLPYTNCGSPDFKIPFDTGDFHMQFPDYMCDYHANAVAGVWSTCLRPRPDTWDTYYAELTLGKYGQSNSHLVMWHRDTAGVWKRYVDRQDATFKGDGGLEHLMLTVYQTGKDASKTHAEGHVYYDDLVIATKPFKDLIN